ncbi:MAG: UDP-2,3-diacylglucosamine diphosphatase LpxI [Leptospira sp.]|nr:UDP-2,3-diacylglucosamine diphosphatase LpxI [Leptospira sp.]
MGRLAIVAGSGELPHIGFQEALALGEDPLVFSINESDFDPGKFQDRHFKFHITKIGELVRLCKKNKIDRLLLLGKVNKDVLYKTRTFDLKAIAILARMINKHDYTIFKAIADELAKDKITVVSQKKYLGPLFLPEGRYTKWKLSASTLDDIEFGMGYAEKLADMDVGQTIVVLNKSIVAVEAAEGTDETISRGGNLTGKKGGLVCKSGKRKQDERFDLPTVGFRTLESMKSAGLSTLAIRTGDTIVVNPDEFISHAEKLKINLVSYGSGGINSINGSHKKIPKQ